MAKGKTNAMRILDVEKIKYDVISYETKDGKIDGASVANKIGKEPEVVYKTLVVQGTSKELYVVIVPVLAELNLKKAAKAAGEKKIEMIAVKDIQKLTGYIRGGCSPIGMKKLYKTFIDSEVLNIDKVVVSGGKVGLQIEVDKGDLINITKAVLEDVT